MNCKRCHHMADAHESSTTSHSLSKVGKCRIPYCVCNQYVDPIDEIDEDLI